MGYKHVAPGNKSCGKKGLYSAEREKENVEEREKRDNVTSTIQYLLFVTQVNE
jgi:hypothetical protein